MSLYNMLFGMNPNADQVLALAGLTRGSVGRFRDVWLEEQDGHAIVVVHTRNGGGNRDHWDEGTEPGIGCGCTGCIGTYYLPSLSNYLSDQDDDFDCTYADFRFAILPAIQEYARDLLATQGSVIEPNQKWQILLDALKDMKPEPASELQANPKQGS